MRESAIRACKNVATKNGCTSLTGGLFGLICDERGCPIAVEVFDGNTSDPKTVLAQVNKLRERFGLERIVMVGDRGMLTSARIENDLTPEGIDWISALRSTQIRSLVQGGALQLSSGSSRSTKTLPLRSRRRSAARAHATLVSCIAATAAFVLIGCATDVGHEGSDSKRNSALQAAATATTPRVYTNYIALGDSYSAGIGAPLSNTDRTCGRSDSAWPARAGVKPGTRRSLREASAPGTATQRAGARTNSCRSV